MHKVLAVAFAVSMFAVAGAASADTINGTGEAVHETLLDDATLVEITKRIEPPEPPPLDYSQLRAYKIGNYAGNLLDALTTLAALRKCGVREANPIARPLVRYPLVFIGAKLGVAAFENAMCTRDFKAHRAWRACFAVPIAGNTIVSGLNLRFVF